MTIRSVVLDVDGTLVRGDEPIPGAIETVDRLRERGLDLLMLSNNPTETPAAYAARLADLGFAVGPDDVVTSGSLTADYVAAEYPGAATYLLGEAGLREMLADRGVPLVTDPDRAEVVVASIDREFTYDRLRDALWALEGAAFVASDPDGTIPAADRPVPGSGAVVAALAEAAGRDPDATLGKPGETAADAVASRVAGRGEEVLVVGDRLDTDIALGENAGLATALVLSGITTRADVDVSPVAPDRVLDSVADVPDLLDG
ncbi:HAD-IIA family hydrolase [Halorussus gelatinilyticus]|uniref:HAD-IIA family hydrolase n=1 Tax=Halorussus gelatinilyticus TaxID=2937524 RepID=A0A8U0IJF3_9EURY|nr:HAD-IIA family hydrolase [Halorussus gelatinilyticus]UPW00826.1 HAD-IIA family hydrolase [Halorussus gelatinilyticus]